MALGPKDFPLISPDELSSLTATHNRVLGQPSHLEHLNYSLILPKTWVSESDIGQQEGGVGMPVKIGIYAERPRKDLAVVQVFYYSMPVEVEVIDWLQYQTEKYDQKMAFSRYIQCACGEAVDMGGTYGLGPQRQIIRNTGHADSARIMMVSAMVLDERYPALAHDLAIATNSFHLSTPAGSPKLEQWLWAKAHNPDFGVGYPMSWVERPVPNPPPGKSAVEIYLAKDKDMLAYVRIKATDTIQIPYDTIELRTQAATREIQKAGVVLTSAWEEDKDPSIARIPDLKAKFIARGTLAENPVELRLGMVSRKPLDFSVTLLSVPRQNDRVLWMRSKRAYAIALSSAGPG